MKRLFSILVCSVFLNIVWGERAFAQVEVVRAVKNDLVARQVNLSGPCGAFEITKRVAWVLRAQGVGLLEKAAGTNCQGYSADYVVFPDFSGRDILGDGGGANEPAWNAEPNEPAGTFVGRWRAPFDPGDSTSPEPTPAPTPAPNTELLTRVILIETTTNEILKQLVDHEAKEAAFRKAVEEEYQSSIKPVFKFLGKYILPAVGGLLAGRAIAQ